MIYLPLSQALRKAFLFPSNVRQSVYASGACDKELETNRLADVCLGDKMFDFFKKKKCTLCGEDKYIYEFHFSSRAKDGRVLKCKECTRLVGQEWYKNNKEHHDKVVKEWGNLNRERLLESKRKYNKENKQRLKEYHHNKHIENPEKHREDLQKWRKSNPEKNRLHDINRRAREVNAGGKFTAQEWEALCKEYGNKCLCCGKSDVRLDADHIIPLARGGMNTIDNIQPLCRSCNSKKGINTIDYRMV